MERFVINGLFLTQQITGIQRYATEICRELDKIVNKDELSIIVPKWFLIEEGLYSNIQIIRYGRHHGIVWEQFDLGRYLRKNQLACINFCNSSPLFVKPGITVLHDLMFKNHPEYFTTLRNKVSRIWHTVLADYIVRNDRIIITPSYFSEKEIRRTYKNLNFSTVVVPNAWQHINRINENKRYEERYTSLYKNEYYFSLATRARNKNGKWIVEVAKRNPKAIFVIAGKSYDEDLTETPTNILRLGYISDENLGPLIRNSKAFLFPSIYEGFGIPPLEALGYGTKIIVSDIPVMHEIYGKCAYYIDPYDYNVDLDELMRTEIDSETLVLNKYSWANSAKKIYRVINGIIK